jgi:hypothetical protein
MVGEDIISLFSIQLGLSVAAVFTVIWRSRFADTTEADNIALP